MNRLNWYLRGFMVFYLFLIYVVNIYFEHYTFYMFLNIILAYIPFELGNLVVWSKSKIVIIFGSMLWLLFYPNAPYLVTDFFHLEALNIYNITGPFHFDLEEWATFMVISVGILFGLMVDLVSLIRVITKLQDTFFQKERNIVSFILIVIITVLAGYAIYLGRFPRLHSHYLLVDPKQIFDIIVANINMQSFYFSLVMAFWQIIIIYIVKLIPKWL